jgi:hypothetical protein
MSLDKSSRIKNTRYCGTIKYGAAPPNTSSFHCAAPCSYKLVPITQKSFSALFWHLIICIDPSLHQSCCLSKVVPVWAMTVYRGSGDTAPLILNIRTWCKWAVNFHAPAALSPGRAPVTIEQEAWRAPEPVWMVFCIRKNHLSRFQTRTVQLGHYTDYCVSVLSCFLHIFHIPSH